MYQAIVLSGCFLAHLFDKVEALAVISFTKASLRFGFCLHAGCSMHLKIRGCVDVIVHNHFCWKLALLQLISSELLFLAVFIQESCEVEEITTRGFTGTNQLHFRGRVK